MIQTLKKIALSFGVLAALFAPALVIAAPHVGAVDIRKNLCKGADFKLTGTGNCGTNADASSKLETLLTDIVNIVSAVVGVIAVIMIIVGGLRYITSGGDSGKVGTAKNTLIYAIIGLVVVALAQVIVRFVLSKANI